MPTWRRENSPGRKTIETEYTALAMGPAERRDLAVGIQEAAGSDGINIWDLPRVTLPAGGMTVWEINNGGEVEHAEAIEGIIVHATSPRAFWRESLEMSGGSTPPDCSSEDGKTGTGDPGGDCYECEFNQWGSADTGEGKACKEKRMLFLLRKGAFLPMVVQAPSTSIPTVKSHFMRAVAEHGVSYKFVETPAHPGEDHRELVPLQPDRPNHQGPGHGAGETGAPGVHRRHQPRLPHPPGQDRPAGRVTRPQTKHGEDRRTRAAGDRPPPTDRAAPGAGPGAETPRGRPGTTCQTPSQENSPAERGGTYVPAGDGDKNQKERETRDEPERVSYLPMG